MEIRKLKDTIRFTISTRTVDKSNNKNNNMLNSTKVSSSPLEMSR